jgi:hypothetical protein
LLKLLFYDSVYVDSHWKPKGVTVLLYQQILRQTSCAIKRISELETFLYEHKKLGKEENKKTYKRKKKIWEEMLKAIGKNEGNKRRG